MGRKPKEEEEQVFNSLEQARKKIGLTRERVRQIEHDTLERLRTSLSR